MAPSFIVAHEKSALKLQFTGGESGLVQKDLVLKSSEVCSVCGSHTVSLFIHQQWQVESLLGGDLKLKKGDSAHIPKYSKARSLSFSSVSTLSSAESATDSDPVQQSESQLAARTTTAAAADDTFSWSSDSE
jgi:hypothetical protein